MQTPEQIPPEDQANLNNEAAPDAVNGLVDADGVDLTEDFATGNSTVEYGRTSNEYTSESTEQPVGEGVSEAQTRTPAGSRQRSSVVPVTRIETNLDRVTFLNPNRRLEDSHSLPEPRATGSNRPATLNAIFEVSETTDSLPRQTGPAASWDELLASAEATTPVVHEAVVGSDAPTEIIDTAAIQKEARRREELQTESFRNADTAAIPVFSADSDLKPLGDTQEFSDEDVATLQSWLRTDDEQPAPLANENNGALAAKADELRARGGSITGMATFGVAMSAIGYGTDRVVDALSDNPNPETAGRYAMALGLVALAGAGVRGLKLMSDWALLGKSAAHGKHAPNQSKQMA